MRSLTALFRRGAAAAATPPRRAGRSRTQRRIIGAVVGGLALVAAIAGGGAYLWYSGTVNRTVAAAMTEVGAAFHAAMTRGGLVIAEVKVKGIAQADPEAVRIALAATPGLPIFAFDPAAARARLLQLGWVKEARIQRRLPNSIAVEIDERTPFALWQSGREMKLIDRDGTVITAEHLGRYRDLPLVVGAGAAQEAAALVALVSAQPELFRRMRAATWVSERRWNLRFDSGLDVRLPAEAPAQAILRLAALERDHGILDRKLKAIDLRMSDRLIVQLLEPASARNEKGKDT